jgi:uncharacterized membrane protein YeaQ/YmgE (transglycosylase-associated protein family)
LSPGRLELEITETLLIDDDDTVLRILHELRPIGVRVALDDFGTEYPTHCHGVRAERNYYRRSVLASDNLNGRNIMHLSSQGLLVIIVVGIVAGWLAGRVMEGGGFGLIGDLLVGLIGAFIGDWLLPRLGIHLGAGIVALIINAFIGAVVLLLILRLVGGGWGRRRWS